MSLYKYIIRLFSTNTAYRLFLLKLRIVEKIPFYRALRRLANPYREILARNIWGIDFKSPIGLGAGMDKDARYYNSFSDYGLGFVMTGPTESAASIRRAIENIRNDKPRTVIAMCIGSDYLTSFSLAYDFADMFIIDAPGNDFEKVIGDVLDARLTYETHKPVLYRIGREYSRDTLESLLNCCLINGIDGFLVGSEDYVSKVNAFCSGRVPIIGYGKIRTPQTAASMLAAGASLIAITTGLVLDGPSLIRKTLKYLEQNAEKDEAGI
ncbi:MAG: hypothetical protein MJY50_03805 [Bacteroidales bacterium]|nr:hypothetical protein [Bacteroidales bacterium]